MEVSPRSPQLAITGPSSLENGVGDPSIFKNNGLNFGRPRKLCTPICPERIASWNVEGLRGPSQTKISELCIFMRREGINILCMQETHLSGAFYFEVDGFMVFNSGNNDESERSYAGVGFIVAPWAKSSIVAFKSISDRIASLRVKVTGGMLTILSAYAPHEGDKYPFEVRHDFFSLLSKHTRRHNQNTVTMVCGDFNTQMRYVKAGEANVLGPYVFRKSCNQSSHSTSNRSLFLEYCGAHSLLMANSLFDYPDDCLVTYHNLVSHPMDLISSGNFSQLDYVLCPQQHPDLVYDCWSCRKHTLQSHHFALIVAVRILFPKCGKKRNEYKDAQALQNKTMRETFCTSFNHHMNPKANTLSLECHVECVNDAFNIALNVLPVFKICTKKTVD